MPASCKRDVYNVPIIAAPQSKIFIGAFTRVIF
jgi:hypothetical protein